MGGAQTSPQNNDSQIRLPSKMRSEQMISCSVPVTPSTMVGYYNAHHQAIKYRVQEKLSRVSSQSYERMSELLKQYVWKLDRNSVLWWVRLRDTCIGQNIHDQVSTQFDFVHHHGNYTHRPTPTTPQRTGECESSLPLLDLNTTLPPLMGLQNEGSSCFYVHTVATSQPSH